MSPPIPLTPSSPLRALTGSSPSAYVREIDRRERDATAFESISTLLMIDDAVLRA
jgi:hypothetical protein